MSGSVPLTTLPLFAHAARAARAEGEAERRKAEGMARVQAHTPEGWTAYADTAVKALLHTHREITADDVREVVLLTPPNGKNAWGGYLNGLVKRHPSWLRPVARDHKSRQPQGHGNYLWRYASLLYGQRAA
ncbi:MAG TPA: hypothetical protein VNM48_13390 [Chloroflexota bacterium]|nr:hypothetical protein [Chloroflexota bacterium]